MSKENNEVEPFDAWKPGLSSDIPQTLWPSVTLFREENASVSYATAKELSDLTGLKLLELYALRAERHVVHALLIRVTADLSVTDGPNYADLGINLRGMVDRIYTRHMLPQMKAIGAEFTAEKEKAASFVREQLSVQIFDRESEQIAKPVRRSFFDRLFPKSRAKPVKRPSDEPKELTAINHWRSCLSSCTDPLQKACLQALVDSVDAIVGRRGKLIPDQSLLVDIIVNQVGNTHGADVVNRFIEPLWKTAVEAEGYRLLPTQSKPVMMNVKGASASGKSTIRPQQRQLAESLGIPWDEFALISTDYWRKYLLDYSSLGDDYKYAAMLTGNELEVVDKRLDGYMARKAAANTMSHLLIDRFRFDSFVVDIDKAPNSRLLSRFGDFVYLFFMVTPPAETVVRAWKRGLQTGRYKAVDDLLYHNVEAYTGMPSLFLSWVNSKDKQIHFEFLDNDVVEGELPKTAAFGRNHRLTILDVSLFLNIDRYRKVDIAATGPEEIFKQADLEAGLNTGFIVDCAHKVPEIVLADQDSGFIYARVSDAELVWWDTDYLALHRENNDLTSALLALGYDASATALPQHRPDPIDIAAESLVTVGRWINQ